MSRAGRAGCEGCASYDADLEAATKDLVDAERRAAAAEKALRSVREDLKASVERCWPLKTINDALKGQDGQ